LDYDYNDRKQGSVYSRKLRAGKRRTYFFDVRETRGSDFFVTITETRKRFNDDGFERQKIFIYKEDFNKFTAALGEAIAHVKTELMPDFDFDYYNHEDDREQPRYRQPRNRSGFAEKDPHHLNNEAKMPAEGDKDQLSSFNPQNNTPISQEAQANHQNSGNANEQAAMEQVNAGPDAEIAGEADFNHTADIQAEPMDSSNPKPEAASGQEDNLINVNENSDKLASEEVEKW